MLNHSSATPHTIKSTKNRRQEAGADGRSRKTTISNALRRRAQAIIKDRSIDAQTRANLTRAHLVIKETGKENFDFVCDLLRS